MKKISLFILSVFALGITLAQTVEDFDNSLTTSDNNMSIVFPAGTLDNFVGGLLQAYVNGQPVSDATGFSSEILADGSFKLATVINEDGSGGLSVIGFQAENSDLGIPSIFGANPGDELSFAILMNGEVIVITSIDPPVTYSSNGFKNISGNITFSIGGEPVNPGCTDAAYLEHWNYDAEAKSISSVDPAYNLGDGSCADSVKYGCTDIDGCNFDDDANVNDGTCDFSEQYYECDESCTVDDDEDGICKELEVAGCTNAEAFNYNEEATGEEGVLHAEWDSLGGICIPIVVGCMNAVADNFNPDANTSDEASCIYSLINPWGLGGSQSSPTFVTSNNMSVLFPDGNPGLFSGDNLETDDIIFGAYVTSTLEQPSVGYSAVDGSQSAGAGVWTGSQMGLALFGSDNGEDNGLEEYEEIVWLVKKADDGTIYHAALEFATPGYDGTYEDGTYIIVSSVTIGAPFYDGCMNKGSLNFNPLATNDDGSCLEALSIGCTDQSSINFAGLGANPTHNDAENLSDVFGQNDSINLSTGALSPSGVAANYSDDSYCQTQVDGCMDPMAINYDPLATQNTIDCNWSLNGMAVYDVDVNGNILDTVYNFGAVAPDNQNDGILGSDFGNANILFQDGSLDPDAHVIANLASVMEWIDADEIADSLELDSTITWWDRAYFVNDSTWEKRYNDTLAAVAVWFADDELADSLELDSTIKWWERHYFVNDSTWSADFDIMEFYKDSVIQVTNDTLDYHRAPIEIDLHTQWNTVAYYLHHESPVVAQFENQFGSELAIAANINIVKNNEGLFYWPQFNFDGLGMLIPGQGYQVRVKELSEGKSDFIFEHAINADAYRTLNPTVPQWAIDMPVDVHPNDVRSLVRVVNMLGQEVNPAEQFKGEVLLYMYNDGTVEKKMVQ